MRLKLAAPIGALLIVGTLGVTQGLAQTAAARPGQGAKGATAPTSATILGPAMLRPGTADLACGTGPAGLAQWGIERIEQSLSLTGTALAKFNDLKDASEKAVRFLEEGCPTNDPVTPTGRVEGMERRLEAMLEAVRTVKPALDDFYTSLTDEQKARLNVLDPEPRSANQHDPEPRSANQSARSATTSRYAMNQVPRQEPVHSAASEHAAPHGHHRHHHLGFRIRIPIPF